MYQRILVATDGSKLSHKAVKSAIELAAHLGAELVALHVVPRYPVGYFEGALTLSPGEIARVEKIWTDKGMDIVGVVRDEAQARGVTAESVVVHSDRVGESILAAAKKHHCDLIVMASHGRKGLERVLLGSETQHVLTHGPIPVLVLR
jgi:nucleotide-binding universal stress UspA family protein